jgi:hypothetical protein
MCLGPWLASAGLAATASEPTATATATARAVSLCTLIFPRR